MSLSNFVFDGDLEPAGFEPGFIIAQIDDATSATAFTTISPSVSLSADDSTEQGTYSLTSGTDYYIRFYSEWHQKDVTGGASTWPFNAMASQADLKIKRLLPPSNDDFANAIALTTSPQAGTTESARQEAGEPTVFGGTVDQSVWYTFTPPVDGLD
jgi:hypothetical protein